MGKRPNVVDGAVLFGGVSMMGGAELYPHLSHQVSLVLFWGGLTCAIGWVVIRWGAWLLGVAVGSEAHPALDNRGGVHAGRDNSGTQQIFHGPVTINEVTQNTTDAAPVASLGKHLFLASDRIPVQDAMMYAINRVWPSPGEKLKDGQENVLVLVLNRMRGLAGEGRLTIWGKRSKGHLHTAIPPEFWVTQQIEYMTVVFHDTEESKTEPAPHCGYREVYQDLMVDKHQIEALWPNW